ncbi:hypothetical protein CCAE64S_02347 [Castellaniella caeni]
MNKIFDKFRRPYYIYAPAYTHKSAGIRVMHLLCHYLNRMGEESYIYSEALSPNLWTPRLTAEIKKRHDMLGVQPIAVYPEVVHGNPFELACVVRYILNHIGLLGGPSNYLSSDLKFFYIEEYVDQETGIDNANLLTVPVIDLGLFNNKNNPFDSSRDLKVVYPGRFLEAKEKYPDLFDGAVVITYEWPSTQEEIVKVLRKAKVLYSFANSAIIGEAVFCGCPVVMVDSPYTRRPVTYWNGPSGDGLFADLGIAWNDSQEVVEMAREQTKERYDIELVARDRFVGQLHSFIEKTQSMPITPFKDASEWSVSRWMVDRQPSSGRVFSIQMLLKANPDIGTLGVAIIAPLGVDPLAVSSTLASLGRQHRSVDGVWLIGPGAPSVEMAQRGERVDGDAPWPQLLSERVARGDAPDFLWVLHAGDQLLPHATLLMGEYRLRQPDPLVWYVDEAVQGEMGVTNPMLKPDFNIDLLRSYPYTGRGLVLSTVVVQAVGGLDPRVLDLAPIDLIWRLVEQAGPGVVGHIPEVLVLSQVGLMDWICHAETMVWSPVVTQAHFVRIGSDAQVVPSATLGVNRVDYSLGDRPLVSIIIPTRDQLPVLQACVESVMEKTAYTNYELLLVDNGSVDAGAVQFLAQLEAMSLDQVRVLRRPEPFSFSAMANFAAAQARGSVLLFLDNDIQVMHSDCLSLLLGHALRPEVGVVGARLDYLDGRVQHAGLVLGMNNSVGFGFQGLDGGQSGYMNRLCATQNVGAVSGSCLMMRKDVFNELGGFNEQDFPVYFGDADLCLRATQAGYLVTLAAEVRLQHMGGATRLLMEQFGQTALPDAEQDEPSVCQMAAAVGARPGLSPQLWSFFAWF